MNIEKIGAWVAKRIVRGEDFSAIITEIENSAVRHLEADLKRGKREQVN